MGSMPQVLLLSSKGFNTEEQKELLEWRSGIQNLSSDDKICFHHELSLFESLQTACAVEDIKSCAKVRYYF